MQWICAYHFAGSPLMVGQTYSFDNEDLPKVPWMYRLNGVPAFLNSPFFNILFWTIAKGVLKELQFQ
jgi:hypothetical protein